MASPVLSGRLVVALIALLGMLGPFSVDAYVPAFGAIQAEFGSTSFQVQQSLSAWFLGMGVMSLFHGALSDALGRKPVILATLVVFLIATLGCAFSENIFTLTGFRLLQGLTAGAGHIVGRAIVRDLFEGAEAQRMQSLQVMVFSIAPVLAPLVGGAIVSVTTWRWIFGFIVVFALIALALTIRYLPETHPPAARTPFNARALTANYKNIFFRAEFQWLAGCNAFAFGAIMLYIVFSPALIITHLGLTPQHFVWLYAPMVAGFFVGAAISGKLAGKIEPSTQLRIGFGLLTVACLVNVAISASVSPQLPYAIIHLPLASLGTSLISPVLQLRLLDRFPETRGTAASLLSFTQVMVTTLLSAFFTPLVTRSALSMALTMTFLTALSLFALWQVERNANNNPTPESL